MKKFFLFCVILNLTAIGSIFISDDKAIAISTSKTIVNRVRNQFSPINFNGVKLADAIRIDQYTISYARRLAQTEIGSYKKAKSIYDWITQRIAYDFDKVESGTCVGAQDTFRKRKGTCLDYALLFSAFCSANDIENRIIVGTAWTGKRWGNHAWNEFYDSEKRKWVQVDCTFGISKNSFDIVEDAIYKNSWIASEF